MFVRHPLYFGALFYVAGTSLVLGSWWGLATIPCLALLLAVRIGVEEQSLREGLDGYVDYARRVRWPVTGPALVCFRQLSGMRVRRPRAN